jgi:hypothetical protein
MFWDSDCGLKKKGETMHGTSCEREKEIYISFLPHLLACESDGKRERGEW